MQRYVNTAQFDMLDRHTPPFPVVMDGPAALRGAQRVPPAAVLGNSEFCDVTVERDIGTLWVRLAADAPVKFTPALLADLRSLQDRIATRLQGERRRAGADRLRYQVFASRIPGVFSLGGDLALFRD